MTDKHDALPEKVRELLGFLRLHKETLHCTAPVADTADELEAAIAEAIEEAEKRGMTRAGEAFSNRLRGK